MRSILIKTLRQSVITLILTLLVYVYFLWHFPADRRYTLFFLNKSAGQTAIVMISISYLLGPLCRLIPWFARKMAYRRYIGVAGFLMVVVHVLFSLLQWQDRFGFMWYKSHLIGVSFAYVAAAIFLILTIISSNYAIKVLTSKKWKWIQRTGYIALIFAAVHIFVASSDRWQQWQSGEISMPSSFVVFVIAILSVLLRLSMIVIDRIYPRGGIKRG